MSNDITFIKIRFIRTNYFLYKQKIKKKKIDWYKKKSVCVVLCSKGYPEKYRKEVEILNINKLTQNKNNFIFHAGTKFFEKKIYAIGGRVLNFVSISTKFKKSRDLSIKLIKKLNWKHGFYRKDIGHKIIK